MTPRDVSFVVERLDNAVESPRADDLMRLGRNVMGNRRRCVDRSSPKSSLIVRVTSWGVTEDVAQVSMTSVSGSTSSAEYPSGRSIVGSTGRRSGGETRIRPLSPRRLEYQTGKGTPKWRWRDIAQSHFSACTQDSKRWRICSGCQTISLPFARN